MLTRGLAVRSAIVLLTAGAGACASGNQLAQRPSTGGAQMDRATAMAHWKQVRDSLAAQTLAESEGPRVSVQVNLDGSNGSRRVEASFHMYDDGYVLVGHLGADGRVRVVFPTSPGDDGFVQGDKIYHVPSFFAGFTEEYRWRRATDGYHSVQSRRDSYDGGVGYVFVIASWRPMRFDRITDAGKWETYEISDVRYMADPREAIDEIASVLAGDNREAYTIEYASYTKTNYGALSFATIDRCNMAARYGYEPWLAATALGFSSWSPYGFGGYGFGRYGYAGYGGGDVLGCGSYASSRYSYAYVRPAYGNPFNNPQTRPPVVTPGNPGQPPIIPPRPREPGDSAGGPADPGGNVLDPVRRPRTLPADMPADSTPAINAYRRRGLIAEDARGSVPRDTRRRPATTFGESSQARPSIQEMLTNRRREEAAERRGRADNTYDGYRGNVERRGESTAQTTTSEVYRARPARGHSNDAPAYQPSGSGTTRHNGGGSSYSPRGQDGGSRGGASSGQSTGQSHGTPRSEPRSEPQRTQPSASPSSSPPPRQAPSAPAVERKPQS